MKIKPKIIAGTLSIVTVLSFGAQLPVSAMGNRPGVFQEQFFPDEHNTADELWARAERTNTAEDWEAAADAFDLAYEAYEKAGNVEIAREFLANAYKARGKSNQRNAEKISYNLSRFSVEEIEEKRNQAIDNWNKATECYEEAARLFKSTEARDDEDKKCEKLAKEVRANADFDTALAAWEKANKANTVESWNNAGQLFDQAAQSCRDAGFIEKSSSCVNKSKEALEKAESINKSSINIYTNVANQTVVENQKVNETSTESFFKQAEDVVEKTNSYVAIAQKDCNKVARLYKEAAEVLQVRANTALKEAIEANTIESWNKAAKLYEETAEAFEEDGKDDEANVCIVMSKLAYAKIALKEVEKADTIESWNKVAKINKEFAEEYKKAGDEKKANICILDSKQAYIRVACKEVKEQHAVEKWNELAERYEKLAEEYKKAGDEKEANICILNSKQAYIRAAWKEVKKQPTVEKWNELAKRYEKLAKEYKRAGDEKEANICILKSKQAYNNADWRETAKRPTIEKWNELIKRYEKLAEEYKKAGDEKEANICILNSKKAYANGAMAQKDWNKVAEINKELAKRYEKLAEEYKRAGDEKEANICILNSKKAYANVAIAQKDWNKVAEITGKLAERYEKLAEEYKKAGDEKMANMCILNSKQAYVRIALKEAKKETIAGNWNEASECCSEVAKAYEKMADVESDVNKADLYRAITKEYMKRANRYKQYAQ